MGIWSHGLRRSTNPSLTLSSYKINGSRKLLIIKWTKRSSFLPSPCRCRFQCWTAGRTEAAQTVGSIPIWTESKEQIWSKTNLSGQNRNRIFSL